MRSIFRKNILLTIPAIILLSAGCSKNQDNLPTEPVQIPLSSAQTVLVSTGNTFAFDIFKKIIDDSQNSENVMISPLSISYALSMTVNGANGATRDSMLKALRVSGITLDEINGSYKKLTDALTTVDKRVAISIANSVWVEKNFTVKAPFINILKEDYSADTKQFDITDPNVVAPINNWISDNTNGLIPKMLNELQDNTVMLLVNAIYFKGKWKSEFDKSNTDNATFYKPAGSISTPMMFQETEFKVFAGDGFKIGEFPYGQGNFVMDIILPDATDGVQGIMPAVTAANFESWVGQMQSQKIQLSIPKFKYEYKKGLKEILTGMGMGIAFTDNADLSNISDISLLINDVKHQTYIETNEEGTEAAAATVVGIGATAVGPPPFVFNADHSFIYIIRETTTNSILFMGKVADPSAS